MRGFDIGGLTVSLNYTRQFNRPINEISMQMNTVFAALAGAERIFQVLDEAPEAPDEETVLPEKLEGNIVLEHVNFGYTPETTVLHDLSLRAKPGQKIAFVGSTGAGKTTVTNLLSRFYDIQDGSITVDGIPIEKIPRGFLRRNIAMVLQDTHLFTGTVRENIRYGRLDATDKEVEEAAEAAGADGFIRQLENGYDTVLTGDGANLSQGQRQLLNIARAALSNDWLFPHVNNGHYRMAFCQSWEAYAEAFDDFYDSMDKLEERLSANRFLFGDYVTDSDIRFFVTLARWDLSYFRNVGPVKRRIADYPNIWGYARELYAIPAFHDNTYLKDFAKGRGDKSKGFVDWNTRIAWQIDLEEYWKDDGQRARLSSHPDELFLRHPEDETPEDYQSEITPSPWNRPSWADRNHSDPKNSPLSADASVNPLKGLL